VDCLGGLELIFALFSPFPPSSSSFSELAKLDSAEVKRRAREGRKRRRWEPKAGKDAEYIEDGGSKRKLASGADLRKLRHFTEKGEFQRERRSGGEAEEEEAARAREE
jgi:hypothetical protein